MGVRCLAVRLSYLIEDNGSLDAQDLAAIKRELPEYFQAHLDKDLFVRPEMQGIKFGH